MTEFQLPDFWFFTNF